MAGGGVAVIALAGAAFLSSHDDAENSRVLATTGDESSAVVATTKPPPSTSSLRPGGTTHLEGTYAGPSNFTLATTRCPQVDTVWDAEFVVSPTETWKYHNEYCGTVDNSVFNGSGTFSFELPGGGTLTGTTETIDVPLPDGGGPVHLTVTGGSGPFAGASGTCTLHNKVQNFEVGRQQQSGSFDCDISLPPASSTATTTTTVDATSTTSSTTTTATTTPSSISTTTAASS